MYNKINWKSDQLLSEIEAQNPDRGYLRIRKDFPADITLPKIKRVITDRIVAIEELLAEVGKVTEELHSLKSCLGHTDRTIWLLFDKDGNLKQAQKKEEQ